jgi:diguanylate cyclase
MRIVYLLLKILEIYTVRQVFSLAAVTTAFTTLVPTLAVHFSIGNLRVLAPDIYYSTMAIAFFIPLFITYPIACFLLNMIRLMNLSIQKIDNHIKYDTLTGVLTRAYFLKEVERSHSKGGTFLMIDADHFKPVNDTYGHATGDDVLKEIASSIGNTVRNRGIVGRLGGEEFGVFLENVMQDDAVFIAWEICENMRSRSINTGQKFIQVTLSIGLAVQDPAKCFDTTMREADVCLYQAKRAGRDRVVTPNDAAPLMEMAS